MILFIKCICSIGKCYKQDLLKWILKWIVEIKSKWCFYTHTCLFDGYYIDVKQEGKYILLSTENGFINPFIASKP